MTFSDLYIYAIYCLVIQYIVTGLIGVIYLYFCLILDEKIVLLKMAFYCLDKVKKIEVPNQFFCHHTITKYNML